MAAISIEERISKLEEKMDRILNDKSEKNDMAPWWEKWFGAFKDNPDFDSAMEKGAEYRRSQPKSSDDFESNKDVHS